MPSVQANQRFEEFVETATEIFMNRGFKRTKMSDITRAMGLSEGAVYRYFESKQALFDTVLRAVAAPDEPLEVESLPVPAPDPAETFAFIRECVSERARFETLQRALREAAADTDPGSELEGIVRELFVTISKFRIGVRIVEKSALELPVIQSFWFGEIRNKLVERLADYLRDRMERGWLRPVPNPDATARLILETIVFFARHRHRDPYARPIDEETAEETVIDNILHAYVLAPA